uniref:Uncharacterized protein n=1 Tax=Caenorhabditis japonica TaxID=281687 RepID=A0A8R1E382_CAEJA
MSENCSPNRLPVRVHSIFEIAEPITELQSTSSTSPSIIKMEKESCAQDAENSNSANTMTSSISCLEPEPSEPRRISRPASILAQGSEVATGVDGAQSPVVSPSNALVAAPPAMGALVASALQPSDQYFSPVSRGREDEQLEMYVN